MKADYSDVVVTDPEVRDGEPCIRDTLITVPEVFGYLARGMTHEDLVGKCPALTRDDILACYAYISDVKTLPRRSASGLGSSWLPNVAIAIIAAAGICIGLNADNLPIVLKMPLLVSTGLVMLAMFPRARSVCDAIMESSSRVVVSVIGTVTAAALLGLAFIGGRTPHVYPQLHEGGDLSRLWGPLAAFVWSGCMGAVGLVAVVVYLLASAPDRRSPFLCSARGAVSVMAVAAALALAVLLWLDIYQLVEWFDLEAELSFVSSAQAN